MNCMEIISLTLNLVGLILLFVGSSLVTTTVGKWSGRKDPKFKWGNRIQTLGFAISVIGILLAVKL